MRKLFFIAFIFLSAGLKSQQIPAYHHYYLNPMVFNPAAAGNNSTINAFFMRSQRNLFFEGGNIVNALTVDGGLFDNKLGLGISFYSDVMGASSAAGGLFTASYRVNFSEHTFLRFGLSGGAEDYRINFNQAVVKDPNDVKLNFYYPSKKVVPNMNAGIMLGIKDFQFHFSVPQLLGMSAELEAITNDGSSKGGSHSFDRHFVSMLRYDFKAEKIGLKVSPFALAKYIPGANIYYDGGVVIDFRDFVWLNATYKSGYGVTPSLGFRIKKSFVVSYGYDFILNSTKSQAGTNQEILAGFQFPITGSGDKRKKELEEAQKEIERLNNELLTKQNREDSIQRVNAVTAREQEKKIQERNDSIQKLNDELAAKEEELKRKVEEAKNNPANNSNNPSNTNNSTNPVVNTSPNTNIIDPVNNSNLNVNPNLNNPNKTKNRLFDESQIKKSNNDYFLELDKTDSPQGLYLVFGAFGSDDNANAQLNKYKPQFPEARIIFNTRNSLKYIVLIYSLEKAPIFDLQYKARQMGLSKAWILNYIR